LRHILFSLRLWYLSCTNCPPESSAVLTIDDRFWVIKGYIQALELSESLAPQKPTEPPKLGARVNTTLNELLRFKRIGNAYGRSARDGKLLSDYVEVARDHPAIQRLCATGTDVDERLIHLQEALCSGGSEVGSYEITLAADGKTDCGSGKSKVVACGIPGKGVQLNVKDFSFRLVNSPDVQLLGQGGMQVDLLKVLLHETGHWIGFDHVTGVRRDDLMFGSYSEGMCLSDRNVRDLETSSFVVQKSGEPKALLYDE
jgi:hypothetical protein